VVVGYVIAPQVLASASQGSGPLMARGLQVTEVTAAIPKASVGLWKMQSLVNPLGHVKMTALTQTPRTYILIPQLLLATQYIFFRLLNLISISALPQR